MAKKCRICSQKFTPRFSTTQPVCEDVQCIIEYTRQQREKKEAKDLREQKKKAKIEAKEWFEKKKKAKIELYPSKNKGYLQYEINKLSKLIDDRFDYKCICCGREYGKQKDAAHYSSVGSNSTIRFNLHNIHTSDSYCNNYSNTHVSGYYDGLIKRYDQKYADFVKYELPKTPVIKLLPNEVHEKLTIVRQLIKNFDTYVFKDGKEGRDIFNKVIGIYS